MMTHIMMRRKLDIIYAQHSSCRLVCLSVRFYLQKAKQKKVERTKDTRSIIFLFSSDIFFLTAPINFLPKNHILYIISSILYHFDK